MKERINQICHSVAEANECKAEVDLIDYYPPVINHKEAVDVVRRLCKAHIGEEHLSEDDLPLSASEDYSYFL